MLPELTKLKITAVHCEHLSTHLVTGDGREDVLVRLGYELSSLNPPGNWRRPRGRPRQTWLPTIIISTLVYTQPTVKRKIVLHGGRSWKRLCSHSGRATR